METEEIENKASKEIEDALNEAEQELNIENIVREHKGEERIKNNLNIFDNKIIKSFFNLLHKQKKLEEEKEIKGYQIVTNTEKRQFVLTKLRSLRDSRIAGVIHCDDEGNLHSEIGTIVFENRLIYISEGEEHVKVIKGKKKFYHRDGSYETFYYCVNFLPYTLENPLILNKFPQEFRNLLLDVCHSIRLLSKEWLSREIAGIIKTTQRVILFTAIISFIIGAFMGMVFL